MILMEGELTDSARSLWDTVHDFYTTDAHVTDVLCFPHRKLNYSFTELFSKTDEF